MGLRLDIKKILSSRSDRVKCVDFHPTEPWLLVSLYNGQVHIWNTETQSLIRTFEICELPTRTGKFIARQNWFIVGSDDMHLRVYNYNTHEKVHAFEGHSDYIRCLAVHPTLPYVLSSADDMTIKLWDWEKGWKNVMQFEGHTHYVMSVVFNPKDSNTFASASLDKTIKIWNLSSATPNFTLEGHDRGVNWVDYYHGGEKPYLVSAADDKLVKVWDYQNKSCVRTLEGHTQNVCVACFHPDLPIIISGSEDGTVRIWHATTYRLENTLNYGFERVWAISYQRGSNNVAIGYDEGSDTIKLGREDPVVSMDGAAKIIYAKHNEIFTATLLPCENFKDGDKLPLSTKDLGHCEVYPQTLIHSPNGRFAVVCGDGEYIIYTALSWRNKSFGSALDFCWSNDSNAYAVRESTNKIKTFKAFKEKHDLRITFASEAIYGGALLGVKGNGFVCLYDWERGVLVRRIDVSVKQLMWSENGELLCVACQENFFILKYNAQVLDQSVDIPEEGLESAFELISDISDAVKEGQWIGDCFIYTTVGHKLNYLVGGHVHTLAHFDSTLVLLGYVPKDARVYLSDKEMNVLGYELSLQLLEYQTAILRRDVALAETLLPKLSSQQRNHVAKFLEGIDQKELALRVSVDTEHQFDLAIQLKRVDLAYTLVTESPSVSKWKQLADLSFSLWNLPMGEECLRKAEDWTGCLLSSIASANAQQLRHVAESAEGQLHMKFMSYWLLGSVSECLELLIQSNRMAEAVLFAKTYCPLQVPRLFTQWKNKALKDPLEHEHAFTSLKYSMILEMATQKEREAVKSTAQYQTYKDKDYSQIANSIQAEYSDASTLPSLQELLSHVKKDVKPSVNPNIQVHAVNETVQLKVPSTSSVSFAPNTKTENRLKVEASLDDFENVSDNMSHMSMEVNTAGTESLHGELETEDGQSEMSFTSTDATRSTARATGALHFTGDKELDDILNMP